ncbi:MAG: hypothetical protein AAGI10_02655 [Pseudomonadota bacterium]
MENVVVLAHDEDVRVDAEVLAELRIQLGEAGAEGVIARAMEETANRLSRIEHTYCEQDAEALWRSAKGLVGIAEQIGMASLAQGARAVADAALNGDHVALAAVVNRLMRLGDRSLTAMWELPELSTY